MNTYTCGIYESIFWVSNIKVKAKTIDNLRKSLIAKYHGKGYMIEVFLEHGKFLGTLDLGEEHKVTWFLGSLGEIWDGSPVWHTVDKRTGTITRRPYT